MRAMITTALLAFAMFAALAQWMIAVGPLDRLFDPSLPPGQSFYLMAKLFGMLAATLLIFQVSAALLSALPQTKHFVAFSRQDHRVLGLIVVLLILAHAGSFIAAASVRGDHLALHLLWPSLTSGSYSRGVSFGAIGFWLVMAGAGAAIAVWAVRGLRHRPWLHRLAPIGGALGLVHAVWIGSEKLYVVVVAALALCFFLIALVGRSRFGRRRPA